MALARFERDFTDEDGNLLTGNISVEVRRETGGLVPVYSDRDGASALGNPFVNSGGRVAFHCVGGAYKITVTQGAYQRILRYVAIGTKQEQDEGEDFAGYSMQWETGTSAPPTAGCIRADNATLSSATQIYISETNLGGSSIAARLAELVAGDTITVSLATGAQVSWNITSRADSGAYQTFGVNGHAGETTLAAASVGLQLRRKGADGTDGTGMFSRVRVVATTNIAIATALENGDTVDGVSLVTGDLVLLTGQTAPAENGVYVVPASGSAARDSSFDTYNEHPGVYFSVMEGTAKGDTLWRCTSNKGGTLGSTAIVVTEFTAGLSGLGATDNRLVRTDGTGGNAAQNSAISVDDSGNMSGVANLTANGNVTVGGNAFFGQSTSFTGVSAGAVGPDFTSWHNSASPAAGDAILYWQMLGNDSGGNLTAYAILRALIEDPTNGSEDGGFDLQLMIAGATTAVMKVAPGIVVGAPTGGQKGLGTLNATAVYDDNTLLTCMALQEEFIERGEVDLAKWDAMVPDVVTPERVELVPATFTDFSVKLVPITEEVDGRLLRRFVEQQVEIKKPLVWADPVYDEEGNIVDAIETPLTDEVVVPEQVVSRTHGTARLFAEMLAEGFDPRDPAQYIARLKADQALPGMPTRANWEHNALSGGEMLGRLWLATEMLAIVVMNLHERVTTLEK